MSPAASLRWRLRRSKSSFRRSASSSSPRPAKITNAPIRKSQELRRGAKPLPQFLYPCIGLARFWRRPTFDREQHRAEVAVKFELLSLTFGRIGHSHQLVQRFLKLRGRFRHCRAGGGSMTGLPPAGDGFFNHRSLGEMLGEEFGLVLHELRR